MCLIVFIGNFNLYFYKFIWPAKKQAEFCPELYDAFEKTQRDGFAKDSKHLDRQLMWYDSSSAMYRLIVEFSILVWCNNKLSLPVCYLWLANEIIRYLYKLQFLFYVFNWIKLFLIYLLFWMLFEPNLNSKTHSQLMNLSNYSVVDTFYKLNYFSLFMVQLISKFGISIRIGFEFVNGTCKKNWQKIN